MNLFTIYTRVQKLGGFDAIADNRVWKNLFEDLSEPGKCITQGMTKRKYERILLPFERYEREMRNNSKYATSSELTISTIPKSSYKKETLQSRMQMLKRRRSTSPEIEIIPLKNGAMEHLELSMDQINDIHNTIKPKDFENHQYFNGGSNDGLSVPVHVIVRPTANGSSTTDFCSTSKRKGFDFDKLASSSRLFKSTAAPGVQQKPKEKENIPLMLQNHTTIVPLTRDGVPTFSTKVVELDDSDDDNRAGTSHHAKKRKLDILREGGLEVTPISRRAQAESLSLNFPQVPSRTNQQVMQPNVSLMSLSPMRAPPVIQSLNMYQSTSQVFKNPKEDVMNATKSSKPICLDLTSKRHHPNDHLQQHPTNMSRDNRKSQLSIEEVQRNYRGSNPDLQITLVKPHQEIPSSSSSSYKPNNGQKTKQLPSKKAKNAPSQSIPGVPPLTPAIIAAANELQKLQQQNRPLFPFLSGLDITPMHPSSSSASPKSSSSPPALDPTLMSYFSAFYGNPLLHGGNLLSNLSPAVEFLKLYNSTASNSRIPSSKN